MAARRPIAVEAAAKKDLAALPPVYRNSAIGKAYLLFARRLDTGPPHRDAALLAREMRLCLELLHTLAPPSAQDDFVDEVKARREARMAASQ